MSADPFFEPYRDLVDVLADVVDHAMDDWFITQVPRPATSDDLMELLEAAW